MILAMTAALLPADGARADALQALTADQIVQRLVHHDQVQRDSLKHYTALRHYEVEYHGLAHLSAKMDVEITYDAATGKTFRVVSESGSNLLREKVFKRATDSEREAAQDRASSALTESNYRFHLAGTDSVGGRPAYVLDMTPIKPSKFLLRGKIWVDAEDFGVARMEAEPSTNPSFWISRTVIHSTSITVHGFCLPHHLRSDTKVRVGGSAVLTIDYGTYEF